MRALKHDLIEAEISLTPLIDVCLVLMIILLVVVPMVRVGIAETPEAAAKGRDRTAAPPQPGSPNPNVLSLEDPQLAVAILADGSLVVDGRFVEPKDFQKTLGEIWSASPDRPVIIKGHRRLRYEQVRWVLQSVNAAGFRRAGLMAGRAED
ncbi:MAG TPA: biopolymer transporter ExbD [Thermoanaerobaculia bacterium]|nr:biopolymer transporter ExbD [Thermoanaerobaculia bacterium]